MTSTDPHAAPDAAIDAALATAAALWVATFGARPLPDDADDALELCAARGPQVQNLVADAIHRHGWRAFAEAVRRAGGAP